LALLSIGPIQWTIDTVIDTVPAAGDLVVLQAANHAWRNPGEAPVRFLDVLVSARLPMMIRPGRRFANCLATPRKD
jgi:hypothetical protein